MTKKEAKEKIWAFEFYRNGFHKLSGCDVEVRNIKLRKTKVIADVIFIDNDDISERHNNCEYPIKLLEKVKV